MRRRRLARRGGRLLTACGDLLFAPGCLCCGGAGRPRQAGVCVDCWAAACADRGDTGACPGPDSHFTAGTCPACGEPDCLVCAHAPLPWSWLVGALAYGGPARDLILLYKFGREGGRIRLAGPLAALLAAAVRARGIHRDVDVVAAVPSHWRRTGERGFDAARVLAMRLARHLGLPAPRTLLVRVDTAAPRARPTPAQASDTPAAPGKFRLHRRAERRVKGRTVLLVDDVVTTGSTLRRCAALLAAAGARQVRVAVLARTPLHGLAARRTL